MSTPIRHQGLIALELDGEGAHPAAWRVSDRSPAGLLTGAHTLERVRAAESAGFHAATFDDGRLLQAQGPATRLDAVQRAAFVAPHTRSIALVPVVDVVYTEPFHVATQLASLDYVSGGRAGWIVSAQGTAEEGAAVGRGAVPAAALGDEASDVVEVNRLLWDSWEDDAVIRDVTTGRYLDADRLHYADFRGSTFTVKGPSIIPRPLQGQLPVLAPAGLLPPDSRQGADAVLVSAPTPDQLLDEARGHGAGGPVIAELEVILDARGRTAADRLAELDGWERRTGTLPQRAQLAGSAGELVDFLAQLLVSAQGVRLFPVVSAIDVEELGHVVLPRLRALGLLAPTSPDTTFRELLGLPHAENRFATAGDHRARTEGAERW
jgi:alkanesulfonate monooxygenase SsuD/methylene tetrahydromethanopterin reductase-like flavin-dependent oxidoreductase (luciferase family)